jgi:hypothetical protein
MRLFTKTNSSAKKRFPMLLLICLAIVAGLLVQQSPEATSVEPPRAPTSLTTETAQLPNVTAQAGLELLSVKGRAPKTGYERGLFGNGWEKSGTCDTRNRILARDLTEVFYEINSCVVLKGTLNDPYTSKVILFQRGSGTSGAVQIDHVVALSDAWQKGAQQFSPELRTQFANDGLNLLAVDGPANQNKGDGDAATWLPANKAIRCAYVARQISVKLKYTLWVTSAEKSALQNILKTCPDQELAG